MGARGGPGGGEGTRDAAGEDGEPGEGRDAGEGWKGGERDSGKGTRDRGGTHRQGCTRTRGPLGQGGGGKDRPGDRKVTGGGSHSHGDSDGPI